jgi:NAD(P)H-dependent flavin oxidoreductase YrpB (nitropropane dioxygenase family)
MHYVGFAELASAVSNAGGLGNHRKRIFRCREMTKTPSA